MKGRAKEASGAATGRRDLQREGRADQAGAKAKSGLGAVIDRIKGLFGSR